ncbi:single hybrid motif-containing protein [Mycena vulgaris]|nr:single hybrid motif-containing protein [Mycena vulgaris]
MNCRSVSLVSRHVPLGIRSLHQSSVRRAIMMPAMSPFMTEGTIRRWAKKEGETFHAGDILLQIESDYTTINVEAQIPGIIGKILRPDGSTNVPVEQVIALVARSPQELARLQTQVEAPPSLSHPHFANRGPAKSLMMASVHHTPSFFEIHDASGIRGIVTDHAGSQHHAPPPKLRPLENDNDQVCLDPFSSFPLLPPFQQAAALRKTIVSTLSRRGSGPAAHMSKKCTTTQYFDGIL